jgi:hypothetical protein
LSWNDYKGQLIDKGDLLKTLIDNKIPFDGDINYFIREQPTVDVFAELEKELKDMKIRQNSENTDYYTGYLSAVSTMEGILAELKEKYEKGETE